jgi:hypothetical protein
MLQLDFWTEALAVNRPIDIMVRPEGVAPLRQRLARVGAVCDVMLKVRRRHMTQHGRTEMNSNTRTTIPPMPSLTSSCFTSTDASRA